MSAAGRTRAFRPPAAGRMVGDYTRPKRLDRDLRALAPDERGSWAERACIMEYDGGLSRGAAELAAFECVVEARGR